MLRVCKELQFGKGADGGWNCGSGYTYGVVHMIETMLFAITFPENENLGHGDIKNMMIRELAEAQRGT
jgi:hypothetical protein